MPQHKCRYNAFVRILNKKTITIITTKARASIMIRKNANVLIFVVVHTLVTQ